MTPRPPSEPGTIELVIGPLDSDDSATLCQRVRVLVEGSNAGLVECDVGALTDADLGSIDALARLQLTAERLGRRVRLRRASRELCDLLAFTGLGDVVTCVGSGVEAGGQGEERKEAGGVEEEGDPADPVA